MPRSAETKWIKDIKGYSDLFAVGDQPTLTNQLNNVKVRYGIVSGRGGMTKYPLVQTAAASDIIGLFNYRQADNSHILVRMRPTKVEALVAGVWTDITGTALTGTILTRPQYTLADDSGAGDSVSLLFTNGKDLPRYYNGVGNTASIGSGTSPYSKGIIYYLGFVFLTDVSDNGTFTDVFDGHRTGVFSDDWNNSWDECTENALVLDETPGSWVASVILGRAMIACKSDGFVLVRFTTGATRFEQTLMTDKVGILSALTLRKLDETSAICLGTDNTLLLITAQGIMPISYDQLHKLILPAIEAQRLHLARSLVNDHEKTYYMFYDRSGLSNQLLDSYVSFHYAGKEFSKGTLGQNITAAESFQEIDSSPVDLIVATQDRFTVEFDQGADDDGDSITRTWQTGWQKFQEEGWLHGARMIFERNGRGKVRVDVAVNFGPFRAAQIFSLKGAAVRDDMVEVTYRLPAPVLAEFANIRLTFIHPTTAAATEMEQIGFEVISILKTSEQIDRGQNIP